MAERPILFSAPMVRAILDGRKTQTRRIVKGAKRFDALLPSEKYPEEWVPWIGGEPHHSLLCPHGVPGDVLWVKETWRMPAAFDGDSPTSAKARVDDHLSPNVFYVADGAVRAAGAYTGPPGKTRVSIHMPRWASRISLRITDVRVERLNAISEADALAEGAPRGGFDEDGRFYENPPGPDRGTYAAGFSGLWEHINGPGSWDANPWVWVVSFERIAA